MRIAFFGYQGWGHLSLDALLDAEKDIVGVFTHSDSKTDTWYPSVGTLAQDRGLPTFVSQNSIGCEEQALLELKPDLILSVGYRQIIPEKSLRIPKEGGINLHGSLLPKYRGGAVLNWAIINGDDKIGVTAHIMEKKFDSGDIVGQLEVPIHSEEDVFDVYKKTLPLYSELSLKAVNDIENGTLERISQDESKATYTKQRGPEDGLIDWNNSSEDLYNWIRALAFPYPGAFTFSNDEKIIIWKSSVHKDYEGSQDIQPGTVLGAFGDGFAVKTGDGALLVLSAQIDEYEKMKGRYFYEHKNIYKLEANV
jgi:methionyl-tRNA formyltransferase